VFLLLYILRCFCLSIVYCFFGLFLGCLFLCNQYYEFNIVCVSLSVTCFGSGFLIIEFMHFLHVFIGVVFLLVLFARCFCCLMTCCVNFVMFLFVGY